MDFFDKIHKMLRMKKQIIKSLINQQKLQIKNLKFKNFSDLK